MPISSHLQVCKALLFYESSHVGGAISSIQTFTSLQGCPGCWHEMSSYGCLLPVGTTWTTSTLIVSSSSKWTRGRVSSRYAVNLIPTWREDSVFIFLLSTKVQWIWRCPLTSGHWSVFPAADLGVPQRQPHHCSGLATLPSVGAVP